LLPKQRVLQKYEVDESRCILCGICVDACPYDALRDGADIELSHTSRDEPMIDLLAIAAIDRETEVTYIRRERDWATRAAAEGRLIDTTRMLPMLPPTVTGIPDNGHGHAHGNGHGHGGGTAVVPTHHE
jgi:ferredoxin